MHGVFKLRWKQRYQETKCRLHVPLDGSSKSSDFHLQSLRKCLCICFSNGAQQNLAITTPEIKKINPVINDLEKIQKTLGEETEATELLIYPVVSKIAPTCLSVPGVFFFHFGKV